MKRLKKKAIYLIKSALHKQLPLHVLWITFFMQFIIGLNAQSLQFNSLTIENGLSQNTINALVQDDLGLIWIATQEGFNRYDGNEFKVYKQNTKEPHLGPLSNWITSLHIDNFGTIWLGTNGTGISRFNPITEHFEHITESNLRSGSIEDISTKDSTLFLACADGGVLTWDFSNTEIIKNGSLHALIPKIVDEKIVKTKDLQWISDGDLAVASPSHGLLIYSFKMNAFRSIESVTGEMINPSSLDYNSTNSDLYVGTSKSGVWKFNLNDQVLKKITQIKTSDYIHFVIEQHQSLFVGTDKQGLIVFNNENEPMIRQYTSTSSSSGITDNTLLSVFIDRQEGLWIGTFLSGIVNSNPFHNVFINIEHEANNPQSLRNDFVRGMAEDEYGNLWLAIRNGGISILKQDYKTFDSKLEKKINAILPTQFINTVAFDKKSNVYISTLGFGVYKINLKTFKTEQFNVSQKGHQKLLDNDVRMVYVDENEQLWISSGLQNRGGLNVIDEHKKQNFALEVRNKSINSIPNAQINVIFPLDKNRLLIGSFDGLSVVTKKSNVVHTADDLEIKNYVSDQSDSTTLIGNVISSIYRDKKGDIWLASYGTGFNKLVIKDDSTFQFIRFGEQKGLSVLGIFGILGDEKDQLWFSTNKGLIKAVPTISETFEFKFERYLKEDGILSTQFNQWSALKLSNSNLVFGGLKGITLFNPALVTTKPFNQPVIFSEFIVNGNPVNGDSSVTYKKNYELDFSRNSLGFEYTAISTFGTKRIHYKYKLDGFNDSWIDAGTRTFATFTNIPHGDYVFKVKAIDANENESTKIASISIKIFPPFYLTIPFILSAILLLGLSIFSIIRYRENHLLKTNKELEQKISERTAVLLERTAELELKTKEAEKANRAKTDFLAGMSHELRTPLNAILGFSQLLYKSEELPARFRSYSETMFRSGTHLLSMINDVLDLSKIEAGKMEIKPLTCKLDSLIQDIRFMFEMQCAKKNLAFSITLHDDIPDYLILDNSKIKQVFINLIGNALKFTSEGEISVSLSKISLSSIPKADFSTFKNENNNEANEYVLVEVKDSGKGIDPKKLVDIFEPFKQHESVGYTGTGLGLSISSKLIELHNGFMCASSKPGFGSTFSFGIPLITSSSSDLNKIEELDENVHLQSGLTINVLLVDDIESNLDVLDSILSLAGFTVTSCSNGFDALEKFSKYKFDIILLDLRMPEIDGIEVMQKIRESKAGKLLPIIAVTASIFDESKEDLIKLGFDEVVLKPFKNSELFSVMDRFLDVTLLRTPFVIHENSLDNLGVLIDQFIPLFNSFDMQIKEELLDALIMTDSDAILQWITENKTDIAIWNRLEEEVQNKNYRFILQLSEKLN